MKKFFIRCILFNPGFVIIPVFIPNSLSDTTSFLESFGLNGMILSGGDNLGVHLDRDKTELECLKLEKEVFKGRRAKDLFFRF